jgi:hypothetical protein
MRRHQTNVMDEDEGNVPGRMVLFIHTLHTLVYIRFVEQTGG